MKRIMEWFGSDGLMHIVCCALLTAVLSCALPAWAAALAVLAAGIGKELVWDKLMRKGTCDTKDIVADLCGILIGIL